MRGPIVRTLPATAASRPNFRVPDHSSRMFSTQQGVGRIGEDYGRFHPFDRLSKIPPGPFSRKSTYRSQCSAAARRAQSASTASIPPDPKAPIYPLARTAKATGRTMNRSTRS